MNRKCKCGGNNMPHNSTLFSFSFKCDNCNTIITQRKRVAKHGKKSLIVEKRRTFQRISLLNEQSKKELLSGERELIQQQFELLVKYHKSLQDQIALYK
jgi:hypothetical protein